MSLLTCGLLAVGCGGGGGTVTESDVEASPEATLVTGGGDESPSPDYHIPSPPPEDELPVVIDTPKDGSVVTSPVVVSGTAKSENGELAIFIHDDDYNTLADQFHIKISCGADCTGTYSASVAFKVKKRVKARINVQAFTSSSSGNQQSYTRYVDVTLSP